MRDDEMHQLISRIKARHITVILDACHSGSGIRGNLLPAKYILPNAKNLDQWKTSQPSDGANLMLSIPPNRKGLVFISAVAGDSQSAFERGITSNFTASLTTVLAQPAPTPLTYEQLAVRVRHHLFAFGQTPAFRGNLQQTVFANSKKRRPVAFMVTRVSQNFTIASGLPMPGWSAKGIVHIYGSRTVRSNWQKHDLKAAMSIVAMAENKAVLKPLPGQVVSSIQPGDYAVLVQPGKDLYQLNIRLRPSHRAGGIPQYWAEKINAALFENESLDGLVNLVEEKGDFELALDRQDRSLHVLGPEGMVRKQLRMSKKMPHQIVGNLWLHALQRHLLRCLDGHHQKHPQIRFSISLNPTRTSPTPKNRSPYWDKNHIYHLPANGQYRIKVTYPPENAGPPLNIGGLILLSDGAIYGFPFDGQYPLLKPGQSYEFEEEFKATKPYDLNEHILVFGTSPDNPVNWHTFHLPAVHDFRNRGNPAYRYLIDLIFNRKRTGRMIPAENRGWVSSRLTFRVFE